MAAADSRAGIDGRLSSPPSGGADGAVSCTLDALCIDLFSGQSWPILDFPLGEFPAGLWRLPLPLLFFTSCACLVFLENFGFVGFDGGFGSGF